MCDLFNDLRVFKLLGEPFEHSGLVDKHVLNGRRGVYPSQIFDIALNRRQQLVRRLRVLFRDRS